MNLQRYIKFCPNLLLFMEKFPNVTFSERLQILWDYLKLNRSKGLSMDEYYEFEFEKMSEKFRNDFLGKNEQRIYLELLNPVKYYILARNKYLTHKILEKTGVRKASLYCYYQPEGRVCENDEIANNYTDVVRILQSKNVQSCVVKTTESSHGDNVYVVEEVLYDEEDCQLKLFNGKVMKLSEILKRQPLIFESIIRQTEQLSSINPSSVNTVRFMTTLYPNNEVKLVATFIKIGRAGHCVDNAGAGGNVDACIDMENGMMKYVIQYDGWRKIKQITHHPDTNTQIEGMMIDNWESIKQQVMEFQKAIPYVKAAGWDIAITDEGPVVVEVNDMWDRTGQYFIRRGWRNEIRDCYLAWNSLVKKEEIPYPYLGRSLNKLSKRRMRRIIRKK